MFGIKTRYNEHDHCLVKHIYIIFRQSTDLNLYAGHIIRLLWQKLVEFDIFTNRKSCKSKTPMCMYSYESYQRMLDNNFYTMSAF